MSRRTCTALAASLFAASLTACASETVSAPLPATSAAELRASVRARAFTLDFDVRSGRVLVTSPVAGPLAVNARALTALQSGAAPSVRQSLLGTGVVELQISNYTAGAIGESAEGKIRIRTDLRLVNLLNLALVTSTFPTPPAGATGIQAFPFEITAIQEEGGAFVPSLPGSGPVQPSSDWSGPPHNFLNDVDCASPSSDCFPYESFASLSPLAVSEAGSIGFLVEPTVRQFRVTIIVAADLQTALIL